MNSASRFSMAGDSDSDVWFTCAAGPQIASIEQDERILLGFKLFLYNTFDLGLNGTRT